MDERIEQDGTIYMSDCVSVCICWHVLYLSVSLSLSVYLCKSVTVCLCFFKCVWLLEMMSVGHIYTSVVVCYKSTQLVPFLQK